MEQKRCAFWRFARPPRWWEVWRAVQRRGCGKNMSSMFRNAPQAVTEKKIKAPASVSKGVCEDDAMCTDASKGSIAVDAHALVSTFVCFWRDSPPPPSGPWPPHSRGLWIAHNDASHLVGLFWTSDQLIAETSTWQNTTLTTETSMPPAGIRTHNLSRRAAADLRLRRRGQ
jgi:hypothetical protein